MAIVILKNNTGLQLDIEDLGISLSSAEIYTATDYFEFIELTESDDLKTYVSDADITVNDGTNDLSIDKGLEHLDIESVHEDYIQDSEGGVIPTDTAVTGAVMGTTTQMGTSFSDTTYITQEYTNQPDVLEWNTSQPTRIQIKADGVYRVSTCYFVRANTPNFIDSYFQLTVNGSAYGSPAELSTYQTEIQQVLICYSIPLVAGDYVTSQSRTDTGDDIDIMGSRFNAFKLEGVEGPAGPPGGTTIEVQDEGTTVTTSTATLNFRGDSVVVSDAGGNQANIDVTANIFEPKYCQVYDSTGLVDINSTTPVSIPFDSQDIRDTDTFNWSSTTNSSRVYVLKTGWYETGWTLTYDGDNSRKVVLGALRKNGTDVLDRTFGAAYTRNNTDDYGAPNSGGGLIYLTNGEYVELVGLREGSSGSVSTFPNTCWMKLVFIREV